MPYLVGSFSKSLFDAIGGAAAEWIGWTGWFRLSQRGLEVLDDLLVARYLSGVLKSRHDAGHLGNEIIEDLHLVKTRLLGANPGQYEEVDRLQGEAELRFALLPPLTALAGIAIFAIPLSGLVSASTLEEVFVRLVVLGPPAFFILQLVAAQAITVGRQANDKLLDALLLEQVTAPAIDRWEGENVGS